ncbi:Hsp20/alpha crystallin family protein [Thalassospira sp.]|uniref:Hsp20/alpha crystallin family protein n=1 Tax=Thalassospira sp. TaxID=1912094 RepID=UPI0027374D87|nr:Hsp20/alpha crystallin family protein [Thalassospira sp.]MDP2700016.1 Hsp20/alpha crystallin family protein [Thalassospira sp.]
MTGLQTFNGASRRLAGVPVYADPFAILGRDMNRVLGSILGQDVAPETAEKFLNPRIDVHETADFIEVAAELPGVDEKDIDVSVFEGVLTVTGEKKSTRESDEGARIVERRYGSFKRSFRLPENVDADNIAAKFDKGVLVLTLPKIAEIKPEPRKIAVNG